MTDPPPTDPDRPGIPPTQETIELRQELIERARRAHESASQTLHRSAVLLARHQRRSQLPHATGPRQNGIVHDSLDNLSEQAEIDAEMAASLALIKAMSLADPQLPPPFPSGDIADQRLNQIKRQLDQRKQELDAREHELDRREASLDQREIEQNLADWPPAPSDATHNDI